MFHDPTLITLQAKELVLHHGDNAESIAEHKMMMCMQSENVSDAGFWMAVIQEVRMILDGSHMMN